MKKILLLFIIVVFIPDFGSAQTYMLYGWGGQVGSVYSYNPLTRAETTLVVFNEMRGKNPTGGVIQATNGLLYGMAPTDSYSSNEGLIYSLNINNGTFTIEHEFAGGGYDGTNPTSQLLQAKDGYLYGLTQYGGTSNYGALIRFDPTTKSELVFVNFSGLNGRYPHGSLIQASNGIIYGMTQYGGTNNCGTIFAMGSSFTTVDLDTSIEYPSGSLMQASNGMLYGTASYANGSVVFCFNPATNKDSLLFRLSGTNGFNTTDRLIQANNGIIYGTTVDGGDSGKGVIFSFDPVTGIHSKVFDFTTKYGANPQCALIQATNNLLYGEAGSGPGNPYGILFSYNITTSRDSVLLNFDVNIPATGIGPLLQANNELLYGVSCTGGPTRDGCIFSYNLTTNKDSDLFDFNVDNGAYPPPGGLILGSDNKLYGVTRYGGDNIDAGQGEGTIFSIDPKTGRENVVHNANANNGDLFPSSIMQGSNGLLYGTSGGASNGHCTSIYSLNPVTYKDTSYTTSLCGANKLMEASNGLIYGTLDYDGIHNYGVLFSFDPKTYVQTALHNFDSISAGPGNLMQAKNGLIYGMTGWNKSLGTLYSFDPNTNIYSTLVNFNDSNGAMGASPGAEALLQATDGLIYGTTTNGGLNGYGTLFSFNPVTDSEKVLFNFSFDTAIGNNPTSGLVQAPDSLLYGTTSGDGNYAEALVLYSYNIKTNTHTKLYTICYDATAPCSLYISPLVVGPAPVINTTSVENINNIKKSIKVFPNPFRSYTQIQFNEEGTHYVEVDDMTGRKPEWVKSSGIYYTLQRNQLVAGMYLVKIYDVNKQYQTTSKIMIE